MLVFTLPYTITDEEYVAFNDHHLRCTPSGRKTLRNCRLALILIAVLLSFYCCMAQPDASTVWLPIALIAILTVLFCVSMRRGVLNASRKSLKKAHKTGRLPFSPRGELTVDFENRTILDKTEKANLEIPFSSIERFYEAETAFYLYLDQKAAFIITYRLFNGTDELIAFRDAARAAFQQNPPKETLL